MLRMALGKGQLEQDKTRREQQNQKTDLDIKGRIGE